MIVNLRISYRLKYILKKKFRLGNISENLNVQYL